MIMLSVSVALALSGIERDIRPILHSQGFEWTLEKNCLEQSLPVLRRNPRKVCGLNGLNSAELIVVHFSISVSLANPLETWILVSRIHVVDEELCQSPSRHLVSEF